MMLKSGRTIVCAAIALTALPAAPASAQKPKTPDAFTWQLTNQFRLLTPADEKTFRDKFDTYKNSAHKGKYSYKFWEWQKSYALFGDKTYAMPWNAAKAQYDLDKYVRSRNRVAALSYAGGKKCVWTVNGAVLNGQRCNQQEAPLKLGTNTVTVSVDGQPASAVTNAPVVEDFFAVVLGDSTASGEGNPEVPVKQSEPVGSAGKTPGVTPARDIPAKWMDERCHRSIISGPLLALFYKSQKSLHRSMTVVDYACSGAEIDNGILDDPKLSTPYQGRETPEQIRHFYRYGGTAPAYYKDMMLPAQIKVAEEALCRNDMPFPSCDRRKPDAVIIITGANDVKFSDVLMNLILHCKKAKAGQEPACYTQQRDEVINPAMVQLENRYIRLHERIKTWEPAQVLMGGYVDPTHDQDGHFCGDKYSKLMRPHFLPFFMGVPGSFLGINLGEAKSAFAYDTFLRPLDQLLTRIGAKYSKEGWTYVNAYTEGSRKKGFCSTQRWVLTYQESADKQGVLLEVNNPDPKADDKHKTVGGVPTGAMHPNVFGHFNMARAFLDKLPPR